MDWPDDLEQAVVVGARCLVSTSSHDMAAGLPDHVDRGKMVDSRVQAGLDLHVKAAVREADRRLDDFLGVEGPAAIRRLPHHTGRSCARPAQNSEQMSYRSGPGSFP